ncbi:nitrate- and nitrite sensing domain-containing protein [Nonomuraea sp. NPDC050663]|uniref:sensor histidine kinase n=1 Tax=Nonomuraea sp. NPDC050663 TaxID=3364370 RepID=UPI0037A51407
MPKFALRNWRVRWRLTALILVPTIAGVTLAGARVVTSIESVGSYTRVASAAEMAGRLRETLQAIGLERDTVGWYVISGNNKSLREHSEARVKDTDRATSRVLEDLATIDDSYGTRAAERAKSAAASLRGLPSVRKEKNPSRYSGVVDNLLRLHEELSLITNDPQIVGQLRGLSALARAKEAISQQRIMLLQASYQDGATTAQQVEDFIAMRDRQKSAVSAFGSEAGSKAALDLSSALNQEKYYKTELTKARAIVLAGSKGASGVTLQKRLIADDAKGITAWFNDNSWVVEQIRTQVEKKYAEQALLRAQELREAEVRNAILAGVAILVLLLLVLLLTVAIARSMVTPLRRLRSEALEIAGIRLPDVVRNLRVSGETTPPDVLPIPIDGKDEIGEVAQAFDEVHRQAVRLAAEEAELRGNISAMFVNLSRRTQTLVERQISLIDGLEKGEQDGGRLADLFKLDHLATRMRRNSENLLVLAGHEPARRRSQPARLVDVVRAALSEVEDYERVQVRVHRATMVVGSAANDLVHLVAELVENAVQFSPKNSQVGVSSSVIEGGGALLSVSDSGISMTDEEIAEANRRLAEPPVVDVSVSRRMGLFVVGRLALRHGIRVQLRKGEGSGLIAMILLPQSLIPDSGQQPAPQRPAFGGNQNYQPQPNGAFPSYGDSWDTTGAGSAQRQGLGSFTADTTGSFSQPNAFTPGSHPSFPSNPGSYPSLENAAFPSLDNANFPSFPSGDNPLPQREPRPHGDGAQGQPGFGDQRPGSAFPSFGSNDQPSGNPYPSFGSNDQAGGSFSSFGQNEPQTGAFSRPTGAFPNPMAAPHSTGELRRPPHQPPSVEVSPMEPEREEFLPIFAAVESAWFRRPDATSDSQRPATPAAAAASAGPEAQSSPAPAVPSGEDAWRTAADAGWRAAQAASDPSLGGITQAGLPRRTPKANLVPGTVSQSAQPQQPQPAAPVPPPSADRVRSRLSSFQQGVRRGRAELNEQED